MRYVARILTIAACAGALGAGSDRHQAQAQCCAAVTAYYPSTPVVSYYPSREGLFGLRTVYRPVVTYTAPSVITAAPGPSFYAPAPVASVPVTTYYAAVEGASVPVTSYYAPVPVMSVPVTTTYYSPGVIGY